LSLPTTSQTTFLRSTTSTRYVQQNKASLSIVHFSHPAQTGACSNKLASGFTDGSGPKTFEYCGDVKGAIFIHSSGNGGQYANMDIDCDGANRTGGKCANDPTGQGTTAFQSEVQALKAGIKDLDSNLHPYVVFGNEGKSPSFDPRKYGMEPLSVMAVVCNNQVVSAAIPSSCSATVLWE
jgi:chitosanase